MNRKVHSVAHHRLVSGVSLVLISSFPARVVRHVSLFALVSLLSVVVGCSTTHVARSPADHRLFAEVKERGKTERAFVVMTPEKYERDYYADNIQVREDTTTWIDPYTFAIRSVPTRDIERVNFTGHWKGALKGGIRAGLFGLGTGVILSVLERPPTGYSQAELTALLGSSLGSICGGAGFVIGGMLGDATNYVLVRDDHEPP